MDVVTTRWVANRQFVAWDQAGHGVVMDASPHYKGEGSGVRPIEMVLYGLAGCTAMDVISILEKKRQDVHALEVRVTGMQRDDFPKHYDRIEVHYLVTGEGVAEEAVRRAIELSEEKYCSVKGIFGPQVEVTSSFEVRDVDAGAPAGIHE